jgi:single-stranded DNA-binding protein
MVDIGNDKEFKRTNINGVSTAYVRFYGFVKGTIGANSVEGVRIIAYGPLAELIYAHIQPGSRVYVMTHLQIRRDKKGNIFNEFVVEEIEYVRGINWDKGKEKYQELIDLGELRLPNAEFFENYPSGDSKESQEE